MKVNIENCIKQAARVLRRKGDEGGYAYMLEEELLRHLKELRDAPAKHGEFFALYRFSDGKDPAPQAQEEPIGAPAPTVKCLYCGKVSDLGRGAVVYEPQPPAPASPAGRKWRLTTYFSTRNLQVMEGPAFAECEEVWVQEVAAPEAGAPGTQTPNQGEKA